MKKDFLEFLGRDEALIALVIFFGKFSLNGNQLKNHHT